MSVKVIEVPPPEMTTLLPRLPWVTATMLSASLSTSLSLASTSIRVGMLTAAKNSSALACGASLTGLTLIETVPIALPIPSLTV